MPITRNTKRSYMINFSRKHRRHHRQHLNQKINVHDDDKIKRTHNTILPKFLYFAVQELQQNEEEKSNIRHQHVRI